MPLVLAVIPARFDSTRFPGKVLAPLVALDNRPMVEEVWRRVSLARKADRVVIATDDMRVAEAGRGFGAEVIMTSDTHVSGTDRVAEAVRALPEPYEVVLNVQGDEPLLTPTSLDQLIGAFETATPPQIATLAEPIEQVEDLFNPNIVKVVTDDQGLALYFSRSAIPYHRSDSARLSADFRANLQARSGGLKGYRKHQGIYAYSRAALLDLTSRPPSSLERDEGLEQLRALAAGFSIRVLDSDFRSMSVDTPADLERVTKILTEATR